MKKSIFRKVALVFLISIFVISINVNAMTFNDVTTDAWYYENVETLTGEGIIGGYPDGTFKPEITMTVDAFIKTMVVALGNDPGNADGYWAQNYIDEAIEMGILMDGDFSDFAKMITRADMSMLAVRTVVKLEGEKEYVYVPGMNDALYNSITDTADIMNFDDQAFILHSYELGIITGYPNGSFKPNDGLKRSEACTVIRRVIEESQRTPYEEPVASEWDLRAEEVYEETGIRPFENTTTDIDDGVITEYELKNILDTYSFESFLSYNNDDDQRDDWNIIFGKAAVELYGDDNLETQLFEVEYIFRNIHDVDETVTNEVVASLRKRVTGVSTPIEKWELDNGAFIQIYGSNADSKTLSITAIGYKF